MEIRRCSVSPPSGTSAPGGETNAYVLGRDPAVLVDPAGRSAALDRLVADAKIEHIVVTHPHPDHVGALAAYAAETDATVWARTGRAAGFRAATGVDPDRELRPGTIIELEGTGTKGTGSLDERIRILDAPGHTSDHIAFEAGRNGPICCGDCAVRDGSVAVTAPEGDMRAYLTTLRRLRAIDPPRLYPGHGPPIDAPRDACERLLAHRRRRERRILEAIAGGATTLEAILDEAYDKNLTGVRDLAKATVVAHLEKLDVEDRLEWDGERARLTPDAVLDRNRADSD
ncbi:MBL fold metallo-hydrolase [Halopiger aswanensis]|uniref:Glyoxylase-like metal-dependent hydrolase (Beta-lactamase superfamily II) n=1 Tax=Halopiger aswanensis TaxID=148449 RepID=A0A419WIJ9_9EURY|nr:MBL fold metallo-hydrolase [Halopiger aswanensis]RKD95276.1 glyoxylase-like metal-dependent hydrolase (beta-lactamase superfamily II) [Halopiger aswanensis]